MSAPPLITYDDISKAAEHLGKGVLDYVRNGRQALLLSDQSFLHRLTLGSVNRDVNLKWVQRLKTEMNSLILSHERTTFVACIHLRDLVANTPVQAVVLDGQHRFLALKELYAENPHLKYEFWIQLYIVASEAEMETLIHDMDRRLVITQKDKKTISDRRIFTEAFLSLIPETERTRRCVTGTLGHAVLRSQVVVEALQHLSFDELVLRIQTHAALSEAAFRERNMPKNTLSKFIEKTKLYHMVEWESGEWIQQILGVGSLV